jgi:hypothetical protein
MLKLIYTQVLQSLSRFSVPCREEIREDFARRVGSSGYNPQSISDCSRGHTIRGCKVCKGCMKGCTYKWFTSAWVRYRRCRGNKGPGYGLGSRKGDGKPLGPNCRGRLESTQWEKSHLDPFTQCLFLRRKRHGTKCFGVWVFGYDGLLNLVVGFG